MSIPMNESRVKKPMHVLLADDNEDDVMLIRRAFKSADVPVDLIVVPDGAVAMQFLRGESQFKNAMRPDLVLLDINMPCKNGFDVLSEMKTADELKGIPVIIMTTSRRKEDVDQAYADGACSFITKPATIEELETVARHLWIYWTSIATLPAAG